MSWKISLYLVVFIGFCSCKNESSLKILPVKNSSISSEIKALPYLVEATEMLQTYSNPNVKIIDFRKGKSYNKGHIEGAIQIWRDDFENDSFPYGGMLPKAETIEILFSSLGIKNNDLIIVYDDRGSCDAVRFWWVLQYYNFKSVKILNGGIDEWKDNEGAISSEQSIYKSSHFTLQNNLDASINISKNELLKKLNSNSKAIILDTRTEDEFSGKRQKKGALKGGRIPKSILFDWDKAIDYSNNKKLKSIKELKELVTALQISETDTIITYCHSGVRSAHTYFVLKEVLGLQHVYNYDGSWTEWSYFEELPFEKDSITELNN
jgi:thiosulfate/3-mercaptopyruvate sulfurtransferase